MQGPIIDGVNNVVEPQRTYLQFAGSVSTTDLGTKATPVDAIQVKVVDEKLHLAYVAEDFNLQLDTAASLSSDNTPVIRKAFDVASGAVQSGRTRYAPIQLPVGVMRVSRIGTMPPRVTMVGDPRNPYNTQLYCRKGWANTALDKTKFGGETFIDCAPGQFHYTPLEGIYIVGDFGSGTAATASAHVPTEQYGTGVRVHAGHTVQNLWIEGFCYNLDARVQHTSILANTIVGGKCWAGLYLGPRDQNQGDFKIDNVLTEGAGWASIACHPTHYLGGGHIGTVHTGYGAAWGIWKMAQGRKVPDYTTGTVDVTLGSKVVIGHGTSWLSNAKEGGLLTLNGSYMPNIATVDSDTQLTLLEPWAQGNGNGVSYAIKDGAGLNPLVLDGCVVEDFAFENIRQGFIGAEDQVVNNDYSSSKSTFVTNNTFYNVGVAGTPYSAAAAINVSRFDGNKIIGGGIYAGSGSWNEAFLKAANVNGNDFGDVDAFVNYGGRAKGIPFILNPAGGIIAKNNTAFINGRKARLYAAVGAIVPGDLVEDGLGSIRYQDNARRYRSRGRQSLGVAQTKAAGLSQVALVTSEPNSVVTVNVAPTVEVSQVGSAGATPTKLTDTSALAGIFNATLVNASGGVVLTNVNVVDSTTISHDPATPVRRPGNLLYVQQSTQAMSVGSLVKTKFSGQVQLAQIASLNWRTDVNGGYWQSGARYSIGDAVYGQDGVPYRNFMAGVTATPVNDPTHWIPISPPLMAEESSPNVVVGQVQTADNGRTVDIFLK